MNHRMTSLGALATLAGTAVACGGSSTPATTAGGEAAGAEGGGEAALTKYADPATKVSLQRPASWTKTSDAPLTFTGQDEYIKVELRVLVGTDALAAAKADEAAVKAEAPGYRAVSLAASTEVKKAAVMSYEWDLAKSAVSGKPVHERADRYYIDLGSGQMAIFTGSSPSARFDREQVRDIALTLQVGR